MVVEKGGGMGWLEKLMAKFQFANIKQFERKKPVGTMECQSGRAEKQRSIGLKANVRNEKQQQQNTSYDVKI